MGDDASLSPTASLSDSSVSTGAQDDAKKWPAKTRTTDTHLPTSLPTGD